MDYITKKYFLKTIQILVNKKRGFNFKKFNKNFEVKWLKIMDGNDQVLVMCSTTYLTL